MEGRGYVSRGSRGFGRGSRVVSVGSGGYYKNKIHAREN